MQMQTTSLTRPAFEAMQQELEYLRTVRRHQVAEQLRQARESDFGAGVQAATTWEAVKEEQSFVEGRIADLERLLASASIIDEASVRGSDTVQLGSTVLVEATGGATRRYQIVSTAEGDPAAGKISSASPIGAALLGKRVGDTVEVRVPAGIQRLRIKALL
jgi:transcription elongation factor GreA